MRLSSRSLLTLVLAIAIIFSLSAVMAAPASVITPIQSIQLDGYPGDTLTPMASSYVGATTTGKFHYTSCRWAGKIRDDHRAYFDSREEAIDAGYVPCKVCRP
jgi:hypothetical protein